MTKYLGFVGPVFRAVLRSIVASRAESCMAREISWESSLKCQTEISGLQCGDVKSRLKNRFSTRNGYFRFAVFKRNAKSRGRFYTVTTKLNCLNIANKYKRTWQRWGRYLVSRIDFTHILASRKTTLFHILHKTLIFAQKTMRHQEKIRITPLNKLIR